MEHTETTRCTITDIARPTEELFAATGHTAPARIACDCDGGQLVVYVSESTADALREGMKIEVDHGFAYVATEIRLVNA